jgi:uncharacterized membrane protein
MSTPAPPQRRGYLDWLRGLAVLVMIEAHILDSWTRFDQRESTVYGWSMILGGFGAPLFLFLAGVAVALSAGSKFRRAGDRRAASRAVMLRGLQIFALAYLFRLQAMIISWGSWMSLLKVDILNIMGPSIVAAAAIWGTARTVRGRLVLFAVVTLALSVFTPLVRAAEFLVVLPDPIEGYLRPRPGFTNFAIFPWAAFVFAGAFVGVLADLARTAAQERRLNIGLATGGLLLAAGAYAGSYMPSLFSNSQFWTSSSSFFLIRTGILIATVGAAYAWSQRQKAVMVWSPLEQMGRTSLFIYWIHIELIYGLMVRPLHKSLTLGEAWIGVVVFSLLMLLASLAKQRVVAAVVRLRRVAAAGIEPRAMV